jgi:hypothetical protein
VVIEVGGLIPNPVPAQQAAAAAEQAAAAQQAADAQAEQIRQTNWWTAYWYYTQLQNNQQALYNSQKDDCKTIFGTDAVNC